jgi:NAD(P)-dependent dehydrogenase (short-subunit alcohol dehydrogenase family)
MRHRGNVNLNLSSLILSNRAAVRQFFQASTGGSILNMGSVLGSRPSPQFFATHVYAATKAAAIGFTKSCAAYYAKTIFASMCWHRHWWKHQWHNAPANDETI